MFFPPPILSRFGVARLATGIVWLVLTSSLILSELRADFDLATHSALSMGQVSEKSSVRTRMNGLAGKDSQILNSVIKLVLIDVVNNLAVQKGPADKFLHHETMLEDLAFIDPNYSISSVDGPAAIAWITAICIRRTTASKRAIFLGRSPWGVLTAANRAGFLSHPNPIVELASGSTTDYWENGYQTAATIYLRPTVLHGDAAARRPLTPPFTLTI